MGSTSLLLYRFNKVIELEDCVYSSAKCYLINTDNVSFFLSHKDF